MFSSASRRSALSFACGGGIDAAALDWRQRVVTAGGSVSGKTLSAVSRFVRSAKGAGYWSKFQRLNLMCGNQLAAALVPLVVGSGSATETNTNFVAGDYTEATGITGDGTSKSLNAGVNPSTALTANDTHIAVYNRASAENASGATMGCYTNTGAQMFTLYAPFGTDTKLYSNQYNASVGAGRLVSAGVIGTPFGFCVGSRTAANAHAAYRNGSVVVNDANSGGALPNNANLLIFALHDGTSVQSISSAVIAGYSIGSGLSAADVAAYYTHIQAFQTALGRNV